MNRIEAPETEILCISLTDSAVRPMDLCHLSLLNAAISHRHLQNQHLVWVLSSPKRKRKKKKKKRKNKSPPTGPPSHPPNRNSDIIVIAFNNTPYQLHYRDKSSVDPNRPIALPAPSQQHSIPALHKHTI
jgi:hypothetical protein